jgi:uncharacterized protein involved in response to NO
MPQPPTRPPAPGPAQLVKERYGLLALGFRPFFLVAGLLAALSLGAWLAVLFGRLAPPSYLAGSNWHAHEMLFGYTAAVIAGFLLTAVRNWSGMPTAAGGWLAALVGLWLAARLAPWLGLPGWLAGGLDIAFFPALALALRRPLWTGPNPANRLFLAVLGGFTLASLLVNLDGMGIAPGLAHNLAPRGQRLMLDLIVVIMLLVGGRVMPFFTRAALPGAKPATRPWLDVLNVGVVLAMLVLHLALPGNPLAVQVSGVAALLGGVLLFARLAGWHDRRAWAEPMLAVLYLGLLWLVAGLILDGLADFRLLPPSVALHVITAGAIGTMTLGMMARVTLGHTGRPMQAGRLTILAFALVTAAALLRGPAVWIEPTLYPAWMHASGACWIGAFGLFIGVYGPMLIAPRIDGKPG